MTKANAARPPSSSQTTTELDVPTGRMTGGLDTPSASCYKLTNSHPKETLMSILDDLVVPALQKAGRWAQARSRPPLSLAMTSLTHHARK
jgi:hypothetical protein